MRIVTNCASCGTQVSFNGKNIKGIDPDKRYLCFPCFKNENPQTSNNQGDSNEQQRC